MTEDDIDPENPRPGSHYPRFRERDTPHFIITHVVEASI